MESAFWSFVGLGITSLLAFLLLPQANGEIFLGLKRTDQLLQATALLFFLAAAVIWVLWRVVGIPLRMLALKINQDNESRQTRSRNIYGSEVTVLLKVKNRSNKKSLQDCAMRLRTVDPVDHPDGPWKLGEVFSLAPGDYKLIPFVRYGEAVDPRKFNCADSFFRFASPNERPYGDRGKVHVATVEVVAHGSAPCRKMFKVWIDGNGHISVAAAQKTWPFRPKHDGTALRTA